MKKPRKGSRVVVIVHESGRPRRVWRTVVIRGGKRSFTPRIGPLIVQVAGEGVVWARGWDTPDARALLAEVALENCVAG